MESFRAALGMIGFNDPSSQEIIDNGFVSIVSLTTVSYDAITERIKHIGSWKEAPPPVVAGQPGPVATNLPLLRIWSIA